MDRPESAELMAGVIADSEDDERRLVYADWLDEHGEAARAEFIRLQVRLAACSPADADYPDLIEREREVRATLWQHPPPAPVLPPGVAFQPAYTSRRSSSSGWAMMPALNSALSGRPISPPSSPAATASRTPCASY